MPLPLVQNQMPWEDVRKEMVTEKGLSEEAADQIGEYVSLQGETFPEVTQDGEVRGMLVTGEAFLSFYLYLFSL